MTDQKGEYVMLMMIEIMDKAHTIIVGASFSSSFS